jgi:hypothetical protein
MARQLSNSNLDYSELRQMPLYYLRSFKMVQALTLYINFRFVLNSNANFIDTFFKKLYTDVFTSKRPVICNFDHISRLIMFMLEKESYIVQNYIFRYNIPYHFLEYLDYPVVYDFLLGVFSPSAPQIKISHDVQKKFWEYLKETRFFNEMGDYIYNGNDLPANKKLEEYRTVKLGNFNKMILSCN